MPGACAYQSEIASAFDAIENNRADAATESLARVACGGCMQRRYCQDQQDDIALQIAKRQTVNTTMIAGEIVDMQIANDAARNLEPLEKLRDPDIKFDISGLPALATPLERLDFVRQAFRARQLRLEGRPPANLEAFTEIAERRTTDSGDLDEQTRATVIAVGAKMAMRYRSYNLTRDRANKPLSDVEVAAAVELFDAYYAEALVLVKAKIPSQGAVYHRPDFYSKLLKVPLPEKVLSKAVIERQIKRKVQDPIAALSERLARHRSVARHGRHLKELGVSKRAIIGEAPDPIEALKAATLSVRELREKYPEATDVVGHFITSFPKDPEAALLAYFKAGPKLAQQKDLAHIDAEYLDKIARQHPFRAVEVAHEASERIEQMLKIASEIGISFPLVRAKYYALYKAPVTEQTVRAWANYDRARALLNGKNVQQWLGVRIVETTMEEDQEQVVTVANNLLARKLLAPKAGLEGLQGKELDWTDEAWYLTDSEKLAILYATNLAPVLGVNCDADALRAALGTDNLKKLVQQVLVPGLFPPDPKDILATIRYRKQNTFRTVVSVIPEHDSNRWDAILAYVRAEVDDEQAAYRLTKRFVNSLMVAYPTGTYSHLRNKLGTAAVIDRAVRPYVEYYKKTSQSFIPSDYFLAKDPAWDKEVLSYVGDLSNLPSNIPKEAGERSVPLSFIRRCQQNINYLNSRDDLSIFGAFDRSWLVQTDTKEMVSRITSILEATQRHRTDLWATASIIKLAAHNFRRDDLESTIQSKTKIARDLYARFGTRIEKIKCARLAFSRKDPYRYLESVIERMDEILITYQETVYMTDYVALQLATYHKSRSTDMEVAAYAERYQYAQDILDRHRLPGTQEVVARLAISRTNRRSVEAAAHAYVRISEEYTAMPEIEQWMVDTAFLQPNTALAVRYLVSLRHKLRHAPSLDQPVSERSVLGDIVGTSNRSVEDEYFADDGNTYDLQKRTLILSKLHDLDVVDQAAVLAVFDLHDLMDRDMLLQKMDDTDTLCQKLGIKDAAALAIYVQAKVLPKLRED